MSRGTLDAAGRKQALQRLFGQGLDVVDLAAERRPRAAGWAPRFSLRRGLHLATFTRQIATLCASGVPLVDSMNVLIAQTEDARVKAMLADVLEAVKAGSSLSDALGAHREVFPEMMVSMVHMGEVSGTLDDVLVHMAELFERQDEIKGEVKAALAYPALVLLLGVASAAVLVAFIIPRLAVMFEGMGESLPLPTRVLCGIADVVHATWWFAVPVLAAGVLGLAAALRRPRFRLAWDRLKLRVPVAGRLIQQAVVARFARALGTLVHADVSIVEALDVARAAVGNQAIAKAVDQMVQEVQTGGSLAGLMRSSGIFPALAVQMVAVGEETGHLDQMLLRVAEAYDRETAASTKVMTSLLAPVLILIVAAIVAFIIVSLVLPIFQLSAGVS